jgi:hypothetical protein
MTREEWLGEKLTDAELQELRYAPRVEVQFLEGPTGKKERYFRHVGRNWVTTFALLPGDDLIIVGEWKQGSHDVSIVPPSGVPSSADHKTSDPYGNCAKREFEEETGIILEKVIPLCTTGIPVSTRQSSQRYFPYLGIPKLPIVQKAKKLDKTEFLKGLVISLEEWMKLIDRGMVYEDAAISITMIALRNLGRLKLSAAA